MGVRIVYTLHKFISLYFVMSSFVSKNPPLYVIASLLSCGEKQLAFLSNVNHLCYIRVKQVIKLQKQCSFPVPCVEIRWTLAQPSRKGGTVQELQQATQLHPLP